METTLATVHLNNVVRDGHPLTPTFGRASFEVALPAMLGETVRLIEPGASIQLDFTSRATGQPGMKAVATYTAEPGGGAITSYWTVTEPGEYSFDVQYMMPTLPKSFGTRLCPGPSNSQRLTAVIR
jgi:hypothetical protein